jgi:hypothetical protein
MERLSSIAVSSHINRNPFVPVGAVSAVKEQIDGRILPAYLFHPDQSFLSDSTLFAAIAFHISQMILLADRIA